MGKAPMNENNNVYFKARKKAAIYNERLYSREGAAELLGVSVSTLADYELGNTKVVPVDKVVLMAEMCNNSQKRQGISRVPGNRKYALVQIWYRMEKKAPARPLPYQMTISAIFRHSLLISPLSHIKRLPAPVSAPQAFYNFCYSYM